MKEDEDRVKKNATAKKEEKKDDKGNKSTKAQSGPVDGAKDPIYEPKTE